MEELVDLLDSYLDSRKNYEEVHEYAKENNIRDIDYYCSKGYERMIDARSRLIEKLKELYRSN